MFTPQVKVEGTWRRVRLDFTVDRSESVVMIHGVYPLVENGARVSALTPRVRLSGGFEVAAAACGLGCRCDATITPRTGAVVERVQLMPAEWHVGDDVVLVNRDAVPGQAGVQAVPGTVARVSATSVWVDVVGAQVRFVKRTPLSGQVQWKAHDKWGTWAFKQLRPATPEWRAAVEAYRTAVEAATRRRGLRKDLDLVADKVSSLTPGEVDAIQQALAPVVARLLDR